MYQLSPPLAALAASLTRPEPLLKLVRDPRLSADARTLALYLAAAPESERDPHIKLNDDLRELRRSLGRPELLINLCTDSRLTPEARLLAAELAAGGDDKADPQRLQTYLELVERGWLEPAP